MLAAIFRAAVSWVDRHVGRQNFLGELAARKDA
jgi:hypothetical protein